MTYDDIINVVNSNFDIKLRKGGLSMGMAHREHPLGVTEEEFHIISKYIIDNNLKNGFEVATGVFLSGLAAGFGFKHTGGKLVTMDCYIEETRGLCNLYTEDEKERHENADGWKLANFLINHYQVPVITTVGFSPDDTESVIKQHFGEEKIDYVFIDAMHSTRAVKQDLNAVLPFLTDKATVFFHDLFCITDAHGYLKDQLNANDIIHPPVKVGYGLGYIIRNTR